MPGGRAGRDARVHAPWRLREAHTPVLWQIAECVPDGLVSLPMHFSHDLNRSRKNVTEDAEYLRYSGSLRHDSRRPVRRAV